MLRNETYTISLMTKFPLKGSEAFELFRFVRNYSLRQFSGHYTLDYVLVTKYKSIERAIAI